jgi:HAD superfamily hydrolase (TIGR01509 family)
MSRPVSDQVLAETKVLLCDADGNLFPSEEPAFDASTVVTNRFLAEYGRDVRYEPEQLRLATTGKNFRTTVVDLAREHGIRMEAQDLEKWVAEEKRVVSAHLGQVLVPDPQVQETVEALARRYLLVIVSSSALTRLDVCLEATGLAAAFPPDLRFSAEDSLELPVSKPDPAIYRHAGEYLGVSTGQAIAIEDAVPGAQSARAAGFLTIGNLRFVAENERAERERLLSEAGVVTVVRAWKEIADLLL